MGLNQYDEAVEQLSGESQNPYDAVVSERYGGQAATLKVVGTQAQGTTPDAAAEALALSKRTGLPADLISRNLDAFKKQAQIADTPYGQMVRETPALASFISDPTRAALVQDDHAPLSAIERLTGIARNIVGAGGAGVLDTVQGLYGLVQAGAEAVDGQPALVPGQLEHGNVDLYGQPKVPNADGTISTVDSFSVEIDGKEVLLPTVTPDGRHLSQADALGEFQKTGRHLGVFESPDAANAYAEQLHNDYAAGKYDARPFVNQIAADSARKAKFMQSLAARVRGNLEGAGLVERGIYGGIESVTNMVPAIAAGLLAGPEATLGMLGATAGGQEYSEARGQGAGVGRSLAAGSIQAAIQVGTEFIPAHRLLGDVAAHAGFITTLAHQIVPGVIGQEIQTAAQDLNEWAFLPANKDRTFADYLQERPSRAAATLVSAIVAIGATTAATHGMAHFVEKLGQAASESKTVQRAPEQAEAFIAQAVHDTPVEHVYAPIETFNSYWQSKGVDPATVAESLTGSKTAYQEAVATGADLPIPTAAYVVQIAPTEHNAFFANELRFAPEQMNAREGKVFAEDLAKQATKAPSPEPTADNTIRDQIVWQLETAGVERSTAESYAAVYASAFQTLSERASVDPVDLFNRYGLQIARPDLDSVARAAQDVAHAPEGTAPQAGPIVSDRGPEQSRPDQVGGGQGPSDGLGTEPRRLPSPAGVDEPFVRRPLEDTTARLTPEVHREVVRILDEMETFPFIERTWNWLGDDVGKRGNASGGDAQIVAGSAGAKVYHDILHYSPLNPITSGKRKGELAGQARGTRNTVIGAIQKLLATGDVHNNLAEGVLRVAENRAAGNFKELYPPELPPSWGIVAPPEFTDAVSAAIDDAIESGSDGGDISFDPKTFTQGERGKITFGNQQVRIDLLQGADLSTVLHEGAHLFLQVMQDLAPQSDAIASDLTTLGDWFEQHTGSRDIGVDQHEQFARGMEAYLMEGKAPSAELRPVFARFRAWLLGVYRSLKGLNVSLSDDVRGVFDRMLASDDAIEQAQAEGHVAPLFTTAESAGMTEAQFSAYRDTVQQASDRAKDDLQQQLMRQWTREQQAWWKTERDGIRATVADEIHQQPVYQAESAIRKGTHPDGTPLLEGQEPVPMKLDKAALVDRYSKEDLAKLRSRQLYAVEGGVAPDAIAEFFGYSSGDELVRALVAAPSMKTAIESETDARMTAKHGDMRIDGTLAARAEQAVNGEHRQRVVEAELKALTKGMVQRAIPPAGVIRQIAEARVAGMAVRDLRPGRFLMAAQRASQHAFTLLSEGSDRMGAVQAKQQELLSLALYRQVRDMQDTVASRVDWVKAHDTALARGRTGKAGTDYLDQWDGMLDRYEFKTVPQKVLDRRARLSDFIAAQEAQGLPVDLPAVVLNDARKVNYQTLSVEEFQGVTDGMQSLLHLARLKNKLLTIADKRALDGVVTDGAASIDANVVKARTIDVEPRLPGLQQTRDLRGWVLAHRPLLAILREMDGFKDGFLFQTIWRPLHEARNAEGTMGRDAAAKWAAIHDARFKGEEASLYTTTYIPEIKNSLSTAARLAVAFNAGNEGNRERLTSAGIGNTGPLSPAQQRAILDTLTAKDWAYVRDTSTLINSYKDHIGAMQKRLNGVEPTWVEPAPFQTAHGEQPGGYYPIAYEGRASAKAVPGPESTFANIVAKSAYARFQTANGHTEARTANTGIPLRADLGVIGDHLQQVVHDLTHREMLIDAGRVLGRKEIQDAIYRNYGDQYYREIQGAFRDVAIGPTPAPDWYRVIAPLRRGASMARLAWNFATIIRHVTNITSGMVRVGAGDVAKAIPQWLGSAKDAEGSAAWISANSDLMGHRWNHRMEELASVTNDIGLNRGKWAATMRDAAVSVGVNPDLTHRFADSYLYGIHKVMQMAEIPTWIAAYRQATDAQRPHADAVASADNAVLDAFGGGDTMDLAGVQRSHTGKLFTTFMSYGLSLHRQNYEIFHRDVSVARKVVDASLLNIVPTMFLSAIFYELGGGKDGWAKEFASEMFAHTTGMFVFARELSSALRSPEYYGPAAFAPFGTASRLIYNTARAIDVDEKKPLEKLKTAGTAGAELAGQYYGVPVYQIEKTGAGILALMEGKTDNPAALLVGPQKGKR